jgi:hypothetical protein
MIVYKGPEKLIVFQSKELCEEHLGVRMGSGEDAQFVFAKYDYTAQGNQVSSF